LINLDKAATLLQQGQHKKAILLFEDLLKSEPKNAKAINYLGICYFYENEQAKGLKLLEKSVTISPNDAEILHNAGSLFKQAGHLDKAKEYLSKALALCPDNMIYLGSMAHLYKTLEQPQKAKQVGAQCLKIKDKIGCQVYHKKYKKDFYLNPYEPVKGYQKDDVNIISFSLWGDDPLYTHGAIMNAMIAPYIYPEWITRFYVDENVSKKILKRLAAYGAQIVSLQKPARDFFRLFWRFLVANDESVTRFICRDCDSRLNTREKVAVDAWVNSGKPFHMMRDSYSHAELILAGMWGGKVGVLPNIIKMLECFENDRAEKWIDQSFLGTMIWPMIKDHALGHDDYYHYYNAQPFPITKYRSGMEPAFSVGSIETWDINRLGIDD